MDKLKEENLRLTKIITKYDENELYVKWINDTYKKETETSQLKYDHLNDYCKELENKIILLNSNS